MSKLPGYFEISTGSSGEGVEGNHLSAGLQARLEWVEGVPVLTNTGAAGQVRINSVPLAPGVPYLLQPGDRITIGGITLTWTAGLEIPKPIAEPMLAPVAQPEPAQPTQYTLMVKTANWSKAFPLTGEIIRLGRAVDNDIPIDDKLVSRYHAQLLRRGDDYEIVDLGSVNGLAFQNNRITKRVLVNGDVIGISRSITLTYHAPQSPAVTPSPTQEPEIPETLIKAAKAAASPLSPLEEPPAPDKTVVMPKKSTRTPETPSTVVVAKKPSELPKSQVPNQTVDQPKPAAGSPSTIISPKQPTSPGDLGETAAVDMASVVESGFDQQFIPAVTPRDTQIPYLIIHLPDRTWEVDFDRERLTIGRSDDNDIQIRDDSISRRHALIERRGDGFLLRDADSRNGVWLGKRRIDQHRLRDGDVISLGRAKLIFKGGFKLDDLTLIGAPRIDSRPVRRSVVFVPGFGGSELWLGSEKIWPAPKTIISNPEIFRLPGDTRIQARNIVSDVVIIPGIMKQEQYSRLGDYLESGLGYERGKDLFEFAYDWRQDIRLNSQRLAQAIDGWKIRSPITIIAHSLGTLVSRYYVDKFGGKDKVERLVLMGGPQYGTPKSLAIIMVGPGLLPFGFGDERMRRVLNTMPSSYQILPIYPYVFDQYGRQVDLLEDESWLPENQRPFLGMARSFRKELGFQASVPAVSIFGYGLKTVLRMKVNRRSDGSWDKMEPLDELGGDSTVPAGSAVLQNSEIHPVRQEHGSLYVDNDVKMRLKVELTRSTTMQRRK